MSAGKPLATAATKDEITRPNAYCIFAKASETFSKWNIFNIQKNVNYNTCKAHKNYTQK